MAEFTSVERERIERTVAVRDTDALPKVPGAGEVFDHDGQPVQRMHNGVLIEKDCYQGAWGTEIIRRLDGHHEPQEEVAFAAIVERLRGEEGPITMIELGSFWAYYSLWLRHEVPSATSLLVEPDPRNLDVGRRNFALNGVDATVVHAAVGPEHGGSIKIPFDSDGVIRPTPTVTLDGLFADHGLTRCDLLLCDIQGMELQMLQGAAAALRDGRLRFLVISTHHFTFSGDPLTHQKCLELLTDAGAHVIAEHTVYESCSGDGLIAVSMDPRDRDLVVDVTIVRNRDSVYGEPERELARFVGWPATRQRVIDAAGRGVAQVRAAIAARRAA
ncbi:hypothetical protein DSM112329_04941 [Paraconexibacter sp. AEG42_29]|uniref:Methyltransferase FkbM domain-containing protein n=1 Tax=Paraconexibacter sp. AEG42_29 TaxID=2997339 RepID=A0AAU7B2E4_9ACTN